MKTISLKEPGVIDICTMKEPDRKASDALIKVKAVGICGSDVGAYRGQNPLVSYPVIIGHEISGEIVEVGENEQDLKIGDKVIVDPYMYCGKCYPCSIGRTNCCENLNVLGVHIDGGLSELFTHPTNMLYKIPDNIPWEQSVMAEPLTIALHAIHRTNLKKGEHVVIIGAGTIGLLAALSANIYGAIPILIDIIDERLQFAQNLGINHTINSAKDDALTLIKEITKDRMAEVVIEASGANSAIRSTLDYVSYAGRIAFTGWPKDETLLPTALITKKELDIRGSRTSAGEFPEALDMIANKHIDVKPIISKVITLDEVPETIKELSQHPEKYLKINVLL